MTKSCCGKDSCFGLSKVGHFIGHFFLLIIRLYWGALFIKAGFTKFMNLDAMANSFGNLSIPFPMVAVIVVAIFEILGGVSWILGLFSRIFTIPLIVIVVVAYLTAHIQALTSIFSDPSVFTSDKPFLFLFVSLVIFCFGAGAISIDYLINKKSCK